jgi:hypothetical protein
MLVLIAYQARRDVADIEEMGLHGLTWTGVTACHVRTCRLTREAWKKARREPSEKNLHARRKKVKNQYHQCLALHRWLGGTSRLCRMRCLGASQAGESHEETDAAHFRSRGEGFCVFAFQVEAPALHAAAWDW